MNLRPFDAGAGDAARLDHFRTVARDGNDLAGLVHVDNYRSKRLLTTYGWSSVAPWDDHDLWVGSL